MSKIKNNSYETSSKVGKCKTSALPDLKKSPSKKKRAQTIWDHHDTMIVNLRMWVEREIDNLDNDIRTHAPGLVGKPSLAAALKKAQQLNVSLWDQIRSAQEMADAHKEVT